MVFSADIAEQKLGFGVSGLLYNSDVLLYDRQTEALWSQIKSMAVTGPMKGQSLAMRPVAHTTWRDWQSRYPDTDALSDDTGYRRQYKVDLYLSFKRSPQLYFPVAAENGQYRRKSMVLGLQVGNSFKAYPFKELKKSPPEFHDNFQWNGFQCAI